MHEFSVNEPEQDDFSSWPCLSAVWLCTERAGPCQSPRAPLWGGGLGLPGDHMQEACCLRSLRNKRRVHEKWRLMPVVRDTVILKGILLKLLSISTFTPREATHVILRVKSPFITSSSLLRYAALSSHRTVMMMRMMRRLMNTSPTIHALVLRHCLQTELDFLIPSLLQFWWWTCTH